MAYRPVRRLSALILGVLPLLTLIIACTSSSGGDAPPPADPLASPTATTLPAVSLANNPGKLPASSGTVAPPPVYTVELGRIPVPEPLFPPAATPVPVVVSSPVANAPTVPGTNIALRKQYVSVGGSYRVLYPDSWLAFELAPGIVSISPSEAAVESIGILNQNDLPYLDPKGFWQATLPEIQKQYQKFNLVSEGPIQLGGQPAYEVQFEATVRNQTLRLRYVLATFNSRGWMYFDGTLAADWERQRPVFDAVRNTFQFTS